MKHTACLLGAAALLAAHCTHAATLPLLGVAGGSYTLKVTSLREARFKATVNQQYDFSCGSAALATLLTHQYGYPVSEQEIFQEMYAAGDQQKIRHAGFSLLDIKLYLEKRGFSADGFWLPLEKLEAAKLPAIVLINDKGYHHFVVIKGIRDNRILIGDSATGVRAVERQQFEAIWVNKMLFVIHSHQNEAKFNLAADWNSVPRAPLASAVDRSGLDHVALPKLGPGDF